MTKTALCALAACSVAAIGFAGQAQAQQAKKLFFEGDIVRHALDDQQRPTMPNIDQPPCAKFKLVTQILGQVAVSMCCWFPQRAWKVPPQPP